MLLLKVRTATSCNKIYEKINFQKSCNCREFRLQNMTGVCLMRR
jgi:hypothetical protein